MTVHDFSDLMTGEALPNDNTYSAVELVHEHRHLWVYHTSVGDIVLRRLPLRMQRVLQMARIQARPKTQQLLAELQSLRPFMEGLSEDEIDEETKTRAMEITLELMLTDLSPLGVIVVPTLQSMEDYEDLLAMLTAEERVCLQQAVTDMASVRPAREVDPTPLEIAERLGIKVIPDDMAENLTVSQAEYYVDRVNRERKAIEAMQRRRQ